MPKNENLSIKGIIPYREVERSEDGNLIKRLIQLQSGTRYRGNSSTQSAHMSLGHRMNNKISNLVMKNYKKNNKLN